LAACSDATTATTTDSGAVLPVTSAACSGVQTLTAGQVVTGVSGSSLCVGRVAGAAEYALIPFNGDTSLTTAAFTVTADGIVAPSASADALTSGASASLVGAG